MTGKILTQERLKELLSYDPDTGLFVRLISKGGRGVGSIAGTPHSLGYINMAVQGKKYLAHRLAWFYVHGEWPSSEIDHINHKKSDNRIINLRGATRKDNMRNLPKGGGVSWCNTKNRWIARISTDEKVKYLGSFKDKCQAVAIRSRAELENNYHPNHGIA